MPGKRLQFTMENHIFVWGNQRTKWPFSIAMLVYQRVEIGSWLSTMGLELRRIGLSILGGCLGMNPTMVEVWQYGWLLLSNIQQSMGEVANNQFGDIANQTGCHRSKFSGWLLSFSFILQIFNLLICDNDPQWLSYSRYPGALGWVKRLNPPVRGADLFGIPYPGMKLRGPAPRYWGQQSDSEEADPRTAAGILRGKMAMIGEIDIRFTNHFMDIMTYLGEMNRGEKLRVHHEKHQKTWELNMEPGGSLHLGTFQCTGGIFGPPSHGIWTASQGLSHK